MSVTARPANRSIRKPDSPRLGRRDFGGPVNACAGARRGLKERMTAANPALDDMTPRSDWSRAEIAALFALPFPELMFRAQGIHRRAFTPTEVQISTLLSIKTGGCPEDCARSEEHTSELQSLRHLVCRLLLEKKK